LNQRHGTAQHDHTRGLLDRTYDLHDQVKLPKKERDTRGSVDYEVRTSHRRTERARTGGGGLFEHDASWPGERTGDHRRRTDHG
jgi:hypothetical protein